VQFLNLQDRKITVQLILKVFQQNGYMCKICFNY